MPERSLTTRNIGAVITVAAGTTRTAPHTETVQLGEVNLESVEIIVPTGHVGLTGIRFSYAGTFLVPWDDRTQWIIADGADLTFPVGLHVSGGVVATAHNTDVFQHSFHCRFLVSDLDLSRPVAPTLVVPVA